MRGNEFRWWDIFRLSPFEIEKWKWSYYKFLKVIDCKHKDWVSIQEIKQEMTRTFLQDMKIKEIQLKTDEQKGNDLILTEIV